MPWVLDLDGVVWLADQVIPGAPEAVAELRRRGEPVAFVTNNSSTPRRAVVDKLRRFGIEAADDEVLTSAAAAATLVAPGEVALVCGGPGIVDELERRGATAVRAGDADVVVVGFHRDFDYERLRIAASAIRRGARFVATNDDATYPTPDGPIPGGGAIVAAVATASGVAPVVAGKPHEPLAEAVRARLGRSGVVVGDRPSTDGGFARTLGYRYALVLSGVTTAADLPVRPAPDLVADDLAGVVALTS